jgi:hypothetical protein
VNPDPWLNAVFAPIPLTVTEIASPAVAVEIEGSKLRHILFEYTLDPSTMEPPSSPDGTTNAPGALARVST